MKKLLIQILSFSLIFTLQAPTLIHAEGETEISTESPEVSEAETAAPETQAPETEQETTKEETSIPEEKPESSQAPCETTVSESTKAFETETESQTQRAESSVEETKESETKQKKNQNKEQYESFDSPEKEAADSHLTDDDTSDYNRADSNADLIARQNIVYPDVSDLTETIYTSVSDFRFVKDETAVQAVLEAGAKVYEMTNDESDPVGRCPKKSKGCLVYVLAQADEGWLYIEADSVRGFVKESSLTYPEEELSKKEKKAYASIKELMAPDENSALTYTLTSAYDPVVDKVFAVAQKKAVIYDNTSLSDEKGQITGTLPARGIAYILAKGDVEKGENWIYVESDDVRGFADPADFIIGEDADLFVSLIGEDNLETAYEQLDPELNDSLYYTITSVKEASETVLTETTTGRLRQTMCDFAVQFVGYPYVWGGTSLTNGCDCSGFVNQIYAYFGYSIPRTSAVQSAFGTQIPIEAALPGDLIFYAKEGQVYHVSMYIGDGRVVQASSPTAGIITSGISADAVWATRIIN